MLKIELANNYAYVNIYIYVFNQYITIMIINNNNDNNNKTIIIKQ